MVDTDGRSTPTFAVASHRGLHDRSIHSALHSPAILVRPSPTPHGHHRRTGRNGNHRLLRVLHRVAPRATARSPSTAVKVGHPIGPLFVHPVLDAPSSPLANSTPSREGIERAMAFSRNLGMRNAAVNHRLLLPLSGRRTSFYEPTTRDAPAIATPPASAHRRSAANSGDSSVPQSYTGATTPTSHSPYRRSGGIRLNAYSPYILVDWARKTGVALLIHMFRPIRPEDYLEVVAGGLDQDYGVVNSSSA